MNNKIQGINEKKETLEGKVKKYNKIDLEIPVLFYNSKETDREAYCLEEIMGYLGSEMAQKLKEKKS